MDPQTSIEAIGLGSLDWGGLRRMEPASNRWGFDRGCPVDRYYIESFLEQHREEIQGDCLEVMNANYIRRFGGERVKTENIIDITPNNSNATVVGDLADPATLRPEAYDCFILTQTLPVIFDGRAVIRNAYATLKPGGVLLVTAPCLCRYSPQPEDFWRFTDRSLGRLIRENTDCQSAEIKMQGNLVASIAFLTGLAREELTLAELEHFDSRFPIVVTARVLKPR